LTCTFINALMMYVEEIVDEQEYKRLFGELTFDIVDDSDDASISKDVLDFEVEEEEDAHLGRAWRAINSAILLGPSNLLKKTTPLPLSHPCQQRTSWTPLEREFLDQAFIMHSQRDTIRRSFDEARRRVETDDLILELHHEIRQRHRQHLNTTHSSLPKHLDDTKTALLREVVARNKDTLQPTEWNGFLIVRKPEL
jgi:hypothetical protein